jgi:hypothetical protein
MQNEHTIHERLWGYIDGSASDAEKAAVEQLLATDPVLRSQYEDMLEMHTMLLAGTLEEPSMRFTQNVLEAVATQTIARPAKSYINKRIIYSIAAFFLISITALLVYAFLQSGFSGGNTTGSNLPLPDVKLPNLKLEWNKYLSSTNISIFFAVNAVLLLLITDAWLRRKRFGMKMK